MYYTVSFDSNKNNDYLRQGFPLRIYVKISVKISVKFTRNSGFTEALFFTLIYDSRNSGIPEFRVRRNSINKTVTHCLTLYLYIFISFDRNLTEFDGVLTGISGSICNFWVISGNSVNSGNSVILLKFPLNFHVIPGFGKSNLFPLDFRQSEFRKSRITRNT